MDDWYIYRAIDGRYIRCKDTQRGVSKYVSRIVSGKVIWDFIGFQRGDLELMGTIHDVFTYEPRFWDSIIRRNQP